MSSECKFLAIFIIAMEANCSSNNNPLKALTSRIFDQRSNNINFGHGKAPISHSHEDLIYEFGQQEPKLNHQQQQQQHQQVNKSNQLNYFPSHPQNLQMQHSRPDHEWFNDYSHSLHDNGLGLGHNQRPPLPMTEDAEFEKAFENAFSFSEIPQLNQIQLQQQQRFQNMSFWQDEFSQRFHNSLRVTSGVASSTDNCEAGIAAWNDAFNQASSSTSSFEVSPNEDLEYYDLLHKEFEQVWQQQTLQQQQSATILNNGSGMEMMSNLAQIPIPALHTYTFSQCNPFKSNTAMDTANSVKSKSLEQWKAQAMELYARGEPIKATLVLEACIQENYSEKGLAEIWDLLGTWQSENENEVQSMAAFESCLKLDPNYEHSIQNLAICYTNEGLYREAEMLLSRWLTVTFPEISIAANTNLIDHFTRCLSRNPRNADLQTALGVLFYHRDEMEKAVDCFQTALSITPTDYRLWNRLGATLANSNKSQQAMEAYEKALTLNPAYIRARCNLGVSCVHMGLLRQAIENFLAGLAMHPDLDENNVRLSEDISISTSNSTSSKGLFHHQLDHQHQQQYKRANLLWVHLKGAIEMSDQYDDLKVHCRNETIPHLSIFRKYFDF